MAEMAGPSSSKKMKTDCDKQLFQDFLSNSERCARVSRALGDLLNGSGPIPLVACEMEIIEADANLCKSFGNVNCRTRCHFDEAPVTISIGALFKRGCEILIEYLKNRKVPGVKKLRNVLMVLIAFLTKEDKEQSALFEDRTAENEEDWCLRVAQHLFPQLNYSGEYTIDSGYEGSNRKSCPCSNKDELVGKFGDTSFGCRTLWHGSADLIFGIDMPVNVVLPNADVSESESASSDTVEMESNNTGNDFSLNDKYEMRGQVIGFGFYVNKLESQKENPKYFLTPHIGISKEKMKLLFYDSVHDVLLETSAHKLCCYGNQLSYHIILTIWLVMNYKLFGGETPAILRRYKSGFHSMFPSKLKVYIDDVEAPCHVDSSLLKEERLPNYCKYVNSDVVEVSKALQFKSVDDL